MGRLLTEVFVLQGEDGYDDKVSLHNHSDSLMAPFPPHRSSISHAYTPSRYVSRAPRTHGITNRGVELDTQSVEGVEIDDWDLFPYLRAQYRDHTYSLSSNFVNNDIGISEDASDNNVSDNDGIDEDCFYRSSRLKSIRRNKNVIYRCPDCQTDIARSSNVLSKEFWGSHGKAYLVSSVLNVHLDSLETRQMRTGNFGVKTIHCVQCNKDLGWKYCVSELAREQYKVGKYVIEKNIMTEFSIN